MVQTNDAIKHSERPNDPAEPCAWTRNKMRETSRSRDTGTPENEVAWYAGKALYTKECAHCCGDGFEPMTGKFKESHVCFVCGGEGEVVSNETGATTGVRLCPEAVRG